MENKELTGYPSIDKPWLKYYSKEAINAPLPKYTLYEYLYEKNKNNLKDTAINFYGKKISYGELFERIDITAKAFRALGIKPEMVVTIITLNCVPSTLIFYALNRIGAISNYINVLGQEDDMERYFKEAASEVIAVLDLFGEKAVRAAERYGCKNVIVFSLSDDMPFISKTVYKFKSRRADKGYLASKIVILWEEFLKRGINTEEITYRKNPYSPCFYAHTGGTTGFPKTVVVNDIAMNTVCDDFSMSVNLNRGDIWLDVMVPFVIYGILVCMHMPFTFGFTVVLIPRFNPEDWKVYINKYHPNWILAVPSYFLPLMENERYKDINLSDFSLTSAGGDGLNSDLEREINNFFHQHGAKNELLKGYGMTEVCSAAVTAFNGINKIGSVGIPLIRNNLMIVDTDTGDELKYGQIGEVCLCCQSRMIGYKDDKQATQELFRRHIDGQDWLHTGDLGYVDEDGFLFLVGRMKRVILTVANGISYKVFPNIPEGMIIKIEGVQEVCIVSAKRGVDEVLRAFIVPEKDSDIKELEQTIRQMCKEEMADYMQPTFYEFLRELPLTSVGKVDYRKLEEMAVADCKIE